VVEMPGGTQPQRLIAGQPVSPFPDLGYHEATSMYAFSGKSAEPDSGEKYCGLPEESVTGCRFSPAVGLNSGQSNREIN